ncbi:type II secretion system F family protein [Microbacterium sp. W1N]|uniref:type II secretion system F family protein n=1 Tax=Microbacterium festucae TaxID=2977531 RepID=UPI0021BF27B6|nr:type II secretion system F family protein [Microbacterium festucae]MCT9820399.1 type II secretion system F family protein [Microbacterium festucae]
MNALTHLAYAVVLGGGVAAGLLLVATRVPRWAAPTLSRRLAPYLRDIIDPRGLTPVAAVPAVAWRRRRDALLARLGGADALGTRLRQAGWSIDAVGFRGRQLAWAGAGVALGGAVVVVWGVTGRATPVAGILPVVAGALGAVLCDMHLTAALRRRQRRVHEELPTVLEFLALCLAAGESLRDALARVGEVGTGVLPDELRRAVLASGTGSNLADALQEMATGIGLPALSRATDHVVAALDRGAPLAQVLHDQATDAREDAKRSLIEQAGRKEIVMLLPLVFLILPLSVVFAVFPGVVMLRLGLG